MARLFKRKVRWVLTVRDPQKGYLLKEALVSISDRPYSDDMRSSLGFTGPLSRDLTVTMYEDDNVAAFRTLFQRPDHKVLTLYLSCFGVDDDGKEVMLEDYALGGAFPISAQYDIEMNDVLQLEVTFRYSICYGGPIKKKPEPVALPDECEFGSINMPKNAGIYKPYIPLTQTPVVLGPAEPIEGMSNGVEGVEYA